MDIKTSIRRKSLAEEVAELIKKQISEGKLAKGDKLPAEPELMRLFGVGRSTVREAIKMLVCLVSVIGSPFAASSVALSVPAFPVRFPFGSCYP